MVAAWICSTRRKGLSEPECEEVGGTEAAAGKTGGGGGGHLALCIPFPLPPLLFWLSLGTWVWETDQRLFDVGEQAVWIPHALHGLCIFLEKVFCITRDWPTLL